MSEFSLDAGRHNVVRDGIKLERLVAWMAHHAPEIPTPVEAFWLSGGHSNLTFVLVDDAGGQVVLRRPPLAGVLDSAHDILREYKIIRALADSGVPVPPAFVCCADARPIGAPFYLMAFVRGAVLGSSEEARKYPVPFRAALASEMIGVLARLHELDPVKFGLQDLARPGRYLERQIGRWTKQIEGSQSVIARILREARESFVVAMPPQDRYGIVHGDYRLGNMIAGEGGAVLAVLDWELSALGDTLVDVGWLISSWTNPDEPPNPPFVAPTAAGGFPTREEIAAAYGHSTGVDLSDLDYYIAFSYWRGACIGDGLITRYRSNVMGETDFDIDEYTLSVEKTATLALELIRRM